MNRLDSDRLRRDLRNLVEDAEDALQRMAETTGEHAGDLRAGTARHLREARRQLGAMERGVAARARAAGRNTRDYARAHPWLVIGGFAALVLVAGALSRIRR